MRASVYIVTSLDGFIARKNGDIDWLMGDDAGEEDEDYGYNEFMDTVDALVIGRNSYEKVLTFGGWPYANKPVVILSSQPVRIPNQIAGTVEAMAGPPSDVVRRLAARGANHLHIDGGKTIQAFLDADLIQELTITRIPVLLGTGIPLFGPLQRDIDLRHIESRSFSDGLVQSKYEVVG